MLPINFFSQHNYQYASWLNSNLLQMHVTFFVWRKMPPLNHPVMGTMGYHVRSGGHALTIYDWERYMDFADKHFSRMSE